MAGNCRVGSSRNNVASSCGMATPDASPTRDSQQQRGRAPGTCGTVNLREALLNVVMSNKRKLLTKRNGIGTYINSGRKSGKEVRLPSPPPLGTVRASFPAYGSGLRKRLSRDAAYSINSP